MHSENSHSYLKIVWSTALLILLLFSAGHSADSKSVLSTPEKPKLSKQSLENILLHAGKEQELIETDPDYVAWKEKLEAVKHKKKSGETLAIIGVSSTILCILLAEKSNIHNPFHAFPLFIGSTGGPILFFVGIIKAVKANHAINALTKEGEEKEYLSIAIMPSNKSINLMAKINF